MKARLLAWRAGFAVFGLLAGLLIFLAPGCAAMEGLQALPPLLSPVGAGSPVAEGFPGPAQTPQQAEREAASPAPSAWPGGAPTAISPTLQPTAPLPGVSPTPFQPAPTDTPAPPPVRFAVIGDYGSGNQDAADAAELVQSWVPDFILTVGDNNYPAGSAETIDKNIGQFYHAYISPYRGAYGEGAYANRFFPVLGNHDWDGDEAQPYLDYFSLPGNERYYDFTWSFLHVFALDSDSREPDGVGSNSTQAEWLEEALGASESRWKIVIAHHAPYSSGPHQSTEWMRWPFKEWGADIVLAGHNHIYERLLVEGFPYLVNGLGGGGIYAIREPHEASLVRFNEDYGALLAEASPERLTFWFVTVAGEVVDQYELQKP